MMKRRVGFILLLTLLLASCAPQGATGSLPASSEALPSTTQGLPLTQELSTEKKTAEEPPRSTEETAEKTAEVAVDPASLLTPSQRLRLTQNLPSLDGSTSLIPFEASLRSALYGISYEQAEEAVTHSTTWGSFEKLIAGKVDMIFTCPMSEEQRTVIRESKKDLKEIPVAMEAFVFVVNADNPVDSLTQQQLRDIYSGKITNWKEVGGKDQPIIAYQRNRDSGSQNFMIDFMGETPLTEPPTTQMAGSMGALMDVLAVNDNAVNSIGYSVYSYAADMYENSSLTKFIKVDGVSPNRRTMNDRSYPLLGYNYAVYENTVSSQSPTALLASYLLSPEAQLAAAKAGYVPVTEVDYDFSLPAEQKGKEYQGVGTGEKAPASLSYDYYTLGGNLSSEERLALLKDRELAAELESALLARKTEERTPYLQIYNGYACIGDFGKGFDVKVWDLYTGKQLSFEELFYEGVDVDATLNALVYNALYSTDYDKHWEGGEHYDAYIATDKNDDWTLDFEKIICSDWEEQVAYSSFLISPTFVFQTPRSMEGLFLEGAEILCNEVVFRWNQGASRAATEDSSVIYLLREDAYPKAKEINAAVLQIIAESFRYEDVERESLKINPSYEWFVTPTWEGHQYRGRLAVFSNHEYSYHSVMPCLFFDLESGKRLSWEELFREGWREALSTEERSLLEREGATVCWAAPDTVTVRYRNPDTNAESYDLYLTETLSIPEAYQKY